MKEYSGFAWFRIASWGDAFD